MAATKILTVPNLLSAVRLAGIPLFLYLVLGPAADGLAVVVIAVAGATDYVDGWVARRFRQESALGRLLDPAVDRLYIIAVTVGLAIREIIPIWLIAALLLREMVLAGALAALNRHGHGPLPVHFLGKAATLCLLYAFPLLLLGDGTGGWATLANVIGWAFALWGTGLYWWAGVLYLLQARRLISVHRDRREVTPA